LSSDGVSDDTGEAEFIHLPDDIDAFATSGQQQSSDLLPQSAHDNVEREISNSDIGHHCEIDVFLSQLNTSVALPNTGISPVDLIPDLMRSDLYVLIASHVRAKLPLIRLQS
jgi:hypothetical protein